MAWLRVLFNPQLVGATWFIRFESTFGTYLEWLSTISKPYVYTDFSIPNWWGSPVKITKLYSYKYPDYYVHEEIDPRYPVSVQNQTGLVYKYTTTLFQGGNLKCRLVDSITGLPIAYVNRSTAKVVVPYYEYDQQGNFSPVKTLEAPIYNIDGYCDSVHGNADKAYQYKACCPSGQREYYIEGNYILNIQGTVVIPGSGYVDLGAILATVYGYARIEFRDTYSGLYSYVTLNLSFNKLSLNGESYDQTVEGIALLDFVPGGELQLTATAVDPTAIQGTSVIQETLNVVTQQGNAFQVYLLENVKASGRILDTEGNPAEGVKIEFGYEFDPGTGAHIPNPVYTSINGEWSVEGLNAGVNYLVHPSKGNGLFRAPDVPSLDVNYHTAAFPSPADVGNQVLVAGISGTTTGIDFVGLIVPVPELFTAKIKSANPNIVLTIPKVGGASDGPDIHFRIEVFADQAMTQLIDDRSNQDSTFFYSTNKGATWDGLRPTGLPSYIYAGTGEDILIKAQISVGPRREVYIRPSVGVGTA